MPTDTFTSEHTFLAIDDTVFSVNDNASKCLCEARKNSTNPILTNSPNGPDAYRAHVLGVCFADDRFQMWYLANDSQGQWFTCYAESSDGYNWTKPELSLVDCNGSKNNNIIIDNEHCGFSLTNIYRDLHDPDPAKRYKAPVYGSITQDYFTTKEDQQLYANAPHPSIKTFAYSADGIHWTFDQEMDFPLRRKIESGALLKKGDTWFMVHQMLLGEYPQVTRNHRYLGVSSSKDFKNWEFADEPAFYIERKYENVIQVHMTPPIIDYGNVSVGVIGIFYSHPELHKQETDLTLILTNDGFHWRQPVEDHPFSTILRRGDVGQWDHSFPVQGGLVNTPDKTFIYYSAADKNGNLGYINRQVGMAELPRDRFGYLTPAVGWNYNSEESSKTTLVTHPILIKEKGMSLYLNAQGASRPGDELKVGLLDEEDNPITAYSVGECSNITQDGLDILVSWGDKTVMDPFVGRKIKIKFELVGRNQQHEILACTKYPKLFAFRFKQA